MSALMLLPVFLSFILLGAHFIHMGALQLAILSLAFPVFLLVKRPWSMRLVQGILIAASAEWLRTLLVLAHQRQTLGQPWTKMAVILGSVAAFTAGSSLVFLFRPLKERHSP